MTWLSSSSVGRKVVMSVTGGALVLFLLFHATMNVVVIISEEGYNAICEFLGANWYALIATVGLAFLVVLHMIFAFILSIQNYRARGKERYAISGNQKDVHWASKNMLVLGFIIIGFMFMHLYHFWAKMQLVEIMHMANVHVSDEAIALATNGAHWIKELFSSPVYSAFYLVWLGAIWYHLTHGIWSALHSLGLNNNTWMPRLKVTANIVSTLIVLMFAAVVFYYFGVSLGACCAA